MSIILRITVIGIAFLIIVPKQGMDLRFSASKLERLVIHRVGNSFRNEPNLLSDKELKLRNFRADLQDFYLRPFEGLEANYRFVHHSGNLRMNEVYDFCRQIFDFPGGKFLFYTQQIVKHLNKKSAHPQIKTGDVHFAYLQNVLIDADTACEAIIILKTSANAMYEDVAGKGWLSIHSKKSIPFESVEKAAIILNIKEKQGFQVLIYEGIDSKYWTNFLQVDFRTEPTIEP